MSIIFNKKIIITVIKSCLHIAVYILLGLLLAAFINSTAQAAELDNPEKLRNKGRIEIITRAAGSGNPLSGGIYAVYSAGDNLCIGELTTEADGRADIITEPGMYYIRELRPTFGFLLETERIFLEVGIGETVVMELTKVRDMSIADLSIADLPPDADSGEIIYIPKTGQIRPMIFHMNGWILITVAFICGGLAVGLCIYKGISVNKRSKQNASKNIMAENAKGRL